MQKLRVFHLLIIVVFLLALCYCKKENPRPKTELEKLPPTTQLGKYTFGCLVNGKAMVPDNTLDVSSTYHFGILQILGRTSADALTFFIDDPNPTEKTYELTGMTRSANYLYSDTNIRCEQRTDGNSDNTGTLTITKFDRVNLIVSGTFSLTVSPPNCPKYVITEGRFDLKFIP